MDLQEWNLITALLQFVSSSAEQSKQTTPSILYFMLLTQRSVSSTLVLQSIHRFMYHCSPARKRNSSFRQFGSMNLLFRRLLSLNTGKNLNSYWYLKTKHSLTLCSRNYSREFQLMGQQISNFQSSKAANRVHRLRKTQNKILWSIDLSSTLER